MLARRLFNSCYMWYASTPVHAQRVASTQHEHSTVPAGVCNCIAQASTHSFQLQSQCAGSIVGGSEAAAEMPRQCSYECVAPGGTPLAHCPGIFKLHALQELARLLVEETGDSNGHRPIIWTANYEQLKEALKSLKSSFCIGGFIVAALEARLPPYLVVQSTPEPLSWHAASMQHNFGGCAGAIRNKASGKNNGIASVISGAGLEGWVARDGSFAAVRNDKERRLHCLYGADTHSLQTLHRQLCVFCSALADEQHVACAHAGELKAQPHHFVVHMCEQLA